MEKESLNHKSSVSPVFSVITVTFNAGKVLERTMTSVFGQSYRGIEYIIIDGNSRDNTVEIIKQNEANLAYWVSEPDKGLYDAMNKGLQRSTGDYVMFLNAGDSLSDSECLADLARISQECHLPDIMYGETDLVDAEGKFVAHRRLKAPRHLTWKSFRMGMLVCHQAFIAKRTSAPLYDLKYRFSADFDWCIRCMKVARNIQNADRVLIHYLNEGMTTSNRKASLKERYHIMQKYYGNVQVFLLHLWFAFRFNWARLFGKAL